MCEHYRRHRIAAPLLTLLALGTLCSRTVAAPQTLKAEIKGTQIDVSVEGKLFTSYRFDAKLKKPYLWPVIGPKSGKSVTVESVADQFPHHNSVWFGCDRVNNQNFWQPHGKIENGHVKSVGAKLVQAAGDAVVFTDECIWQKPGAEPVIRDQRRVAISAPSPDLRLIDFEITLRMLTDVTIKKTNHSLFSVRMMPELSVKAGGILVNAQGDRGEKKTFGVASPWCGFYGTRDGIVEGVALLQHPANRWYPCKWFTRDYGFMSPTPMYWPSNGKEQRFPKGEELTLQYRVVVHAGDAEQTGIAKLFGVYARDAEKEAFASDLKAAAAYTFGASRLALNRVQATIRRTPPAECASIETQLLELLHDAKATADAKRFVCQTLAGIGGDSSVKALAPFLSQPELANPARCALEHIGSPAALRALREEVSRADKPLKLGLIDSLGSRRDGAALPLLKGLMHHEDRDVARSAIAAVGKHGSESALRILEEASVSSDLRPAVTRATLACADRFGAAGRAEVALAAYERLSAKEHAAPVRCAALVGLTRSDAARARPVLLSAVFDPALTVRVTAARELGRVADRAVVDAVSGRMASMPPRIQAALLASLRERKQQAGIPLAEAMVVSEDASVRREAYGVLGAAGNATHVATLAKAAATEKAARASAYEALLVLHAKGVTQAIIRQVDKAEIPVRVVLTRALADRRASGALAVLLRAVRSPDGALQKAGGKAFAVLARPEDLPELVRLLVSVESASTREQIARAVTSVAKRTKEPSACVAPVVAHLAKAEPKARTVLLPVLGRLGGKDALGAVSQHLKHESPAVRRAAILTATNWSNPDALPALTECARRETDPVCQVLAIRGMIKLAELPAERSAPKTVAILAEAMELAARPDEKKAALAALPGYCCDEAIRLAKSMTKDPAVAAEAKLALDRLTRQAEWQFDFQPKGSPVEKGFREVNRTTVYQESRGYGWVTALYQERDRGKGTALTRDFVFDRKPRVFRVRVPNGSYHVTVFLGDMQAGHDKMVVSAEGEVVLKNITCRGGSVKECPFEATVEDGTLDIELKDGGGGNRDWTCPGVIISRK